HADDAAQADAGQLPQPEHAPEIATLAQVGLQLLDGLVTRQSRDETHWLFPPGIAPIIVEPATFAGNRSTATDAPEPASAAGNRREPHDEQAGFALQPDARLARTISDQRIAVVQQAIRLS